MVGDEALAAAEEQTHHHGSPFVARMPRGTLVRESERVRLLVDVRRLHLFDLQTGEGVYEEERLGSAPSARG